MASGEPSKRSAANEPPAYQADPSESIFGQEISEKDSEDSSPPRELRSRRQKTQPSSSRRGHDGYSSNESPAGDRHGGKQEAKVKSSRHDDRRGKYDSGDDDRYGGSRRDHGNKARDQRESRSRSRSRDRVTTTALGKHGESSRAVIKRYGPSKADGTGKGSSRAKHGNPDDEKEEEVIKITRYIAADFDELEPESVERLCEVLDVRASKVKQWCEREFIRRDLTTGLMDIKRLLYVLDEKDAKKLRRLMKQLEEKNKVARMYGGHNQDRGYDHSHHGHDHSTSNSLIPRSHTILTLAFKS